MKTRKVPAAELSRRAIASAVAGAFIMAGLPAVVPGADAIPVVSRVAGKVSIQSATGDARPVDTAERTNDGDTLTTQAGGLADVIFGDIGRTRLGPQSVVRVERTTGDPNVRVVSGALCVDVKRTAFTVDAGSLTIASIAAPTIFSVIDDAAGPVVVVYQGKVKAGGASSPITATAGDAFGLNADGIPTLTDFGPLQSRLTALNCPAPAVIGRAQALAASPAALASGSA
ncbi:MAG: FecR domain-containing protein, partial [Vulcanimicrobiaceae bacterium]